MKPIQTVVLLVILVVMVFAVTFASMYVQKTPQANPTKDKGGKEGSGTRLTFTATRYPEMDPKNPGDGMPVVLEYGGEGHHDFWFDNANDEEVHVGLLEKGCSCSEVKVFVAPADWPAGLADLGLGRMPPFLTKLVRIGAFPQLENAGPLRGLPVGGDGITVPPRRVGFVRLQWAARRDKSQAQNLTAKLWMQSRERLGVDLRVGAVLMDPVRIDTTSLALGSLGPGDSAQGVLRCWSSTRPDFGLEVTGTGAPFITWTREPLTDEDSQVLQKPPGREGGQPGPAFRLPIMSGYRIVVSVRERGADGKLFDEGPFSHQVTLRPSVPGGGPMEPIVVALTGTVRGEFTVSGTGIGVRLGTFPVSRGKTGEAILSTDRSGVELKVDRHPAFMKVRLEKLANAGGGGAASRWRLEVEIEPNKVSGLFPRVDSAIYQDTAIYLKIGGTEGRRVRVPVTGQAVQ
jgi:hypothetical protein